LFYLLKLTNSCIHDIARQTTPVITSHPVTQSAPSRAVAPASLAAIAAALRTDPALPQHRRQEMLAALNTTARVLGRDLDQIPGDPALLSRRLAEAAPAAHGVSSRRWNNVRCLVGGALRATMPIAPSRRTSPLGPAWQPLWQVLPEPQRWSLSRLIHFCAERGIAPDAVDQTVFAEFEADIQRSLRKQPTMVYAGTCRTWNQVAGKVPGWPSFRVDRPSRRETWTLPWSGFPLSLRNDVAAWLSRSARRDPLEDSLEDLPFRPPLRPRTLQTRDYQLRQAASALVRRGRDAHTIVALGDLVALEGFKETLRYLSARRGGVPTVQVVQLATLLRSIAHHVRRPREELDAMAKIVRGWEKPKWGMTQVNRTRLRPFDDPDNVTALVRLPGRLVAKARRTKPARKAALLVQHALAIELLLMTALRITNLAALDIERHIKRSRKDGQVWLVLEGDEVKNTEPLEFPLPADTVTLLDSYLRDYRPGLAEGTALFPGRHGRPKAGNVLGPQLSRSIQRHTGLKVNPHLFRHIGAKLYLDDHPGAYEVVRRVLGHRSIDTTTAFYTGLETPAAVRHFDTAILRLRSGATAI
jgi:integrase